MKQKIEGGVEETREEIKGILSYWRADGIKIFQTNGKNCYTGLVDDIIGFITNSKASERQRCVDILDNMKHKTFKYMAMPSISADFTIMGGMKITAGVPFEATASLSEEEIVENELLDQAKHNLEQMK